MCSFIFARYIFQILSSGFHFRCAPKSNFSFRYHFCCRAFRSRPVSLLVVRPSCCRSEHNCVLSGSLLVRWLLVAAARNEINIQIRVFRKRAQFSKHTHANHNSTLNHTIRVLIARANRINRSTVGLWLEHLISIFQSCSFTFSICDCEKAFSTFSQIEMLAKKFSIFINNKSSVTFKGVTFYSYQFIFYFKQCSVIWSSLTLIYDNHYYFLTQNFWWAMMMSNLWSSFEFPIYASVFLISRRLSIAIVDKRTRLQMLINLADLR